MAEGQTRRGVLTAVAAVAGGLAGCHSTDGETISRTPATTDAPVGTPTDTPTSDPVEIDPVEHDRHVGAYYYTWYRPEYGGSRDSSWTELVPDDEPVLGRYNSTSPQVINQHIKWAREHGINWFNISWARESGDWHNGRFIQDYLLPAKFGDEIDFSVFYEGVNLEKSADKSIDFGRAANRRKLRRDFGYFEDEYFGEPNYLTIDGRPVVTFYAAHDFKNTADAFEEAIASLSADPFLIGAVLGANTLTGILSEVNTDATRVFDAATGYMLYDADVAANGDYSDHVNWAEKELETWALAADHVDLDYVPAIAPGLNDSEITTRKDKYKHPILERSQAGFRDLADIAEDRMDPDLDAIMITSFNEWPEYTAVEPSREFGTTYLEIIEGELAQNEQPDYFRPDTHPMLQLRFDRTVPAPQNPVEFAMMADRLETRGADGEPVHSYDIGRDADEPYLLEGAFPPNHTPDDEHVPYDHWRWFGGPTNQTTIYLQPHSMEGATQAALNGQLPPFAADPVGVDIYVNGVQTDRIVLDSQTTTYPISFQA